MFFGNTETEVWQKFLQEAQENARTRLSETVESYLVFMLIRFMRRASFGATPVAIQYLEGKAAGASMQQELLADAADESLIIAGLFPERARRSNVTGHYYMTMSEVCFSQLALACDYFKHKGEADLYREIASAVPHAARTLYAGRNAGAPKEFFSIAPTTLQ